MYGWTPRWDRGLELLPAAQLAVDRINQDPTILPVYNLQLTKLDTGACDHGYPSDAIFQFLNEITQEKQHLVGFVGAFCTTLAKAVALVADSVWATALALNASLQAIDFGTAHKIEFLETVSNELSNVSFTGALVNATVMNLKLL